ncbi:MAG: hypothetical protein GY722_14410, partial [bacterium]|nr:hypothetical protein [bacterium]
MRSRQGHWTRSLFGLVCLILFVVAPLPAIADENDAIGFTPNHVFDGAINGENIDILNGNVNLTIPIGPRFMLNDWFGYQIRLYYNSKIWRIENANAAYATGPDWYGRGVSLHFGRIYRDPLDIPGIYHYETPDGSDHMFCEDQGLSYDCASPFDRTFDAASIKIQRDIDDNWKVWPGDGTMITMDDAMHLSGYNAETQPWGGWYTTRIETLAQTPQGAAQHSVEFYYDSGTPETRRLVQIKDSSGREIDFVGGEIRMPSFGGGTAIYALQLQSESVYRPILEGETPPPVTVKLLKEIRLPGLGTSEIHRFAHDAVGVMSEWQVPTGATMNYVYERYRVAANAPFHSHLIEKTLTSEDVSHTWEYNRFGSDQNPIEDPGSGLSPSILASNPLKVRVLDPLGNLTVYNFKASFNCGSHACPTYWHNGLLESVNTYAGPDENSNRLVRREFNDHVYDEHDVEYRAGTVATEAAVNVRPKETTVVTFGGANGWTTRKSVKGQWSNVDASGIIDLLKIPVARETIEYVDGDFYRRAFTNYQPTDEFRGYHDHVEVTDADGQVVSRTDKQFAYNRLECQVRRHSGVGSSETIDCLDKDSLPIGDVMTANEYDPATGNLMTRTTIGGDTGDSTSTHFTYASGTLETRRYGDLGWNSVERAIDGPTGLVSESYLPHDLDASDATVRTEYAWDALGRLTRIAPEYPEVSTAITYVTLRETRVDQTLDSGNGSESVYLYDDLGRVIEEQRRGKTGTYDFRRTEYDIMGRVQRQSEWASAEENLVWTNYEYLYADTSFSDPLGRVSKVTRPDGSMTTTTYDGPSTAVTIHGIHGPTGVSLDATTTYLNDSLGRLIHVDSADGADAFYDYDEWDNLVEVQLVEPAAPFFVQMRRFEYDRLGRLRLAANPENGTVEYLTYDARGNLVSYEDARDNIFDSTYDAAGRLLVKSLRAGSENLRLVENVYDGYDDGLTSDGSVMGKRTHQYSYRIDHIAGTPSEKLVSKHSYGYGAQTACAPGFQGEVSYSGLNGRLAWTRTKIEPWAESLETRYCQDPMGLSHSTEYPDFDNSGNTRSDVRTERQNGYVWEMHDLGREVQYIRDVIYGPHGAPIEFARGSGLLNYIDRDEQGRPTDFSVWYGVGPQDPFETVMGCGQQGGPDPLDFQQCTGPTPGAPSIPDTISWSTGTYAYDGAGNVKSIGANSYEYDALNRIVGGAVTATSSSYDLLYQYDAFGNMTSRRRDSGPVSVVDSYAVSALTNRLGSHTRGDSSGSSVTDITYDPSGNMREAGDDRYVFDEQNRLREIWDQNVNLVARYDYDASGYRVRAVRNGTETFFFRDGSGALLSEFSWSVDDDRDPAEQPAWNKDYIYGLGQQLVMHKNQAPNQPFGLWASNVSSAGLTLNWSIVVEPDLRNFLITRKVDGGSPTIFGKKDYDRDLLDDFASVPAGSDVVTYSITAYDMAGNASAASPTLTLRPFATDTPPVPQNLFAEALDGAVRVTWDAVDGGDDFWGYRVERLGPWGLSHPTPTVWEQVPGLPVPEPIYLDIGMTNGDEWDYRVVAVNTSGRASAPSNVDRARPFDEVAPTRPVGVTVVPGLEAGSLTVSWLPVLESDIAYYKVTFIPGGYPIPVAPDEFQFTQGGLSEAATYSFTVRAVDTSGNESAESDEAYGTTRTTAVAPPTAVTADFDVDTGVNQIPDPVFSNDCAVSQEYDDTLGVEVSWTGVAVDEYRIYRAAGQGEVFQLVGTVPYVSGQSSYTFFDPNPPTFDHTYYVTAVSGGNESAASISRPHVVGTFNPLASVRNIRAKDSRAAFDAYMDNGRSREVYLAWTPVLEPELQGYYVYRRVPWGNCNRYDLLNNLQTYNSTHGWLRLNNSPVLSPNFTDSTPGDLGGCFEYFVRPVGPNGQEGDINKIVEVDLHENGYEGNPNWFPSNFQCLEVDNVQAMGTKEYVPVQDEIDRIIDPTRVVVDSPGAPAQPILVPAGPLTFPEGPLALPNGYIEGWEEYPIGYYAHLEWVPNSETDLRGYFVEKSSSIHG